MTTQVEVENISDDRDELWTAREVAEYFRVSLPRAYGLMASGKIPVVRIGRSVRVSRKELERWIQKQSAASTAA